MRLFEMIGAFFIYIINIFLLKNKRSYNEILNENIILNRFLGGLITALLFLIFGIITI